MYKALYRKYRPKRFCDVVGQGYITSILENEVKTNRIGHAYLFIGSRGTGKTTCARIFSRAINCLSENPLEKPCGVCSICKLAEKDSLTDITELDAASNNSVNDIREICEFSKFVPNSCKYKVYIIDEVHMLSSGAFNALLKTLEEPPEHVVFLLATTEVQKIPATILSRCQKFEFKKISVNDITGRLNYVAEKENIILDDEVSRIIAQCADGAMRDALSILDKCASNSSNVTEELVCEILMVAKNEVIFKICENIISKNLSEALVLVNKLSSQSTSLINVCAKILDFFRDLMLVKSLVSHGNNSYCNVKELINIDAKCFEKLKNLSNSLSLERIFEILDYIQDTAEKIPNSLDAKLCLQSLVIKLCSSSKNLNVIIETTTEVGDEPNLLKKSEEENIGNAKEKLVAKHSGNNLETLNKGGNLKLERELPINYGLAQDKKKAESKSSDALYANALEMPLWCDVLEKLKETSRTIYTAFKDSKAYVSGQYLLIDSKSGLAFELLKKSVQRDKIRTIIKEVTGVSYRLGPYKGGQTTEGVHAEGQPGKQVGKQLGEQVSGQSSDGQVEGQAGGRVGRQARKQVERQVEEQARGQVQSKVESELLPLDKEEQLQGEAGSVSLLLNKGNVATGVPVHLNEEKYQSGAKPLNKGDGNVNDPLKDFVKSAIDSGVDVTVNE